ncbi:MAG: hypothetical protein HYS52_01385 [Candidatus Wildermuthbacteria bacterium]|nr:hypothetical protein [Candidatus Wildermuthbacteria bacterium]
MGNSNAIAELVKAAFRKQLQDPWAALFSSLTQEDLEVLKGTVDAVYAKLTPRQRACIDHLLLFDLHGVEKLKPAQLARKLNVSPSAVAYHQGNALWKLRNWRGGLRGLLFLHPAEVQTLKNTVRDRGKQLFLLTVALKKRGLSLENLIAEGEAETEKNKRERELYESAFKKLKEKEPTRHGKKNIQQVRNALGYAGINTFGELQERLQEGGIRLIGAKGKQIIQEALATAQLLQASPP